VRRADAERQQLADFVARQQQLTQLRTAERNRLRRASAAVWRESIERTLLFFEQEMERVESELNAWWDEHGSAWREPEARLRTMPGVGPKTARVLLAQLPELGQPAADRVAGRAGSVCLRERAVARTASHSRRPRGGAVFGQLDRGPPSGDVADPI